MMSPLLVIALILCGMIVGAIVGVALFIYHTLKPL